jgi:deoxyribodipyrimidine photolyase-related protein
VAKKVETRLGKHPVLFKAVQKQMIERILYVPFDHLNKHKGVLREADVNKDVVVLVQSERMLGGRKWHPERLFFLLSSARHFADELENDGFQVRFIKASTTVQGLLIAREEFGVLPIYCAEPSSFRQYRALEDFGVNFIDNDFFLTSRKLFGDWASKQKTFVMENFYRSQRMRLNILLDGNKPTGGRWNFDHDNRLPPPKNYVWQEYFEHKRDETDLRVAAELGINPSKYWATTRSGAISQLDDFIKNHLAGFGPYEDAMSSENWAMHHSRLSPYLNNGLLTPEECIEAVLDAFQEGMAPIESVEAFIRQIIGWREYINGMYWFLGEEYKHLNGLEAGRKLLPLFQDSTKTQLNCVKSIVADVEERAWVHHIPRLMVLSNLALLTGVNPQEFLDWMRENFIDATEWVMVPNIIGMATHADSGLLMTKPYAAGGAYIKRMGQYCGGCRFDPSKRVGDDACPFTTLYWDFLDRNKGTFQNNHRMWQQYAGLKRLTDLEDVKTRAVTILGLLEKGEI